MYCLLILSYFSIGFNLVLTRKYCIENQYKEDEDENIDVSNMKER